MKNYVLGFVFSPDLSEVYLIRKNRPEWQAGFLNGIGGKVEEGEAEEQAMAREAWEESGYDGEWIHYAHMGAVSPEIPAWKCSVYYSVMRRNQAAPATRESEPIECVNLVALPILAREMISNIPALIYGALLHHGYCFPIKPMLQIRY